MPLYDREHASVPIKHKALLYCFCCTCSSIQIFWVLFFQPLFGNPPLLRKTNNKFCGCDFNLIVSLLESSLSLCVVRMGDCAQILTILTTLSQLMIGINTKIMHIMVCLHLHHPMAFVTWVRFHHLQRIQRSTSPFNAPIALSHSFTLPTFWTILLYQERIFHWKYPRVFCYRCAREKFSNISYP